MDENDNVIGGKGGDEMKAKLDDIQAKLDEMQKVEGDPVGFDYAQELKERELEEPMLKLFEFEHLPANLRDVSKPFCMLARHVVHTLPRNPERTVCLRKLVEAKDCAVRTLIV